MNPRNRSPQGQPEITRLALDWMPAVAAVLLLVLLASAAGQFGARQLAAVAAGVGIVGVTRAIAPEFGLRRILDACHHAALIGLVLALCQAEQRGTHRWLSLFDLNIPVGLFLTFTTPLHLAANARSTGRRIACGAALLALGASASYTLTFVCATACAAAFPWRAPRVALSTLALVGMGLAAIALANPNRLRRVAEFYAPTGGAPFQVERARETLGSLKPIGEADGRVGLPCAATDFALLDLGRRRGFLAMGAWLLAQTGLLVALSRVAGRRAREFEPTFRATTALVLSCALGHVAVCLTALPPAGVPVAFSGSSGSSWLAFGFLIAFAAAIARPAAAEAPIESPGRFLRLAPWALPLSTVLLLGAGSRLGARATNDSAAGNLSEPRIQVASASGADDGRALVQGNGCTDVEIEICSATHADGLPLALARLLLQYDRSSRLGQLQVTCRCLKCGTADRNLETDTTSARVKVRLSVGRGSTSFVPDGLAADLEVPDDRPLAFVGQDVFSYLERRLPVR